MSELPAGEYLTDVPYVRHFWEDLSPAALRLVAALNGFAPPPPIAFDYCELGAGNGDSLVALAAAYPHARFVGVDLNPEHVSHGRALATRAGLANVRFVEADFEALEGESSAAFDYVVAHGVLSWVGAKKWSAAVRFAEATLRDHGLFYVSYNAMPGSAAMQPLRRLLVDSTRLVPGGSLERAEHGVRLAQLLSAGGAAYFAQNPLAKRAVSTMLGGGLAYVAHEYFHENWRPMYFLDVATELAERGLHFLGQLPPYLNYRDLTVPGGLLELMKLVDDRLLFESLKDYALNESFRRDVYVKGTPSRSEERTARYLDETPFGSLEARGIEREVRLPTCTLAFRGPVYDAVVEALSGGGRAVEDLAREPVLERFGAVRIREAVKNLVLGGQLVPFVKPTRRAPLDADRRHAVVSPHNRMVLAQRLARDTAFILASERAGTAIAVTLLEAVALRCLSEAPGSERPRWIHELVAKGPLDMHVGDRAVTDPAEQEIVLAKEIARLAIERLPKLVEIGIVEPAP